MGSDMQISAHLIDALTAMPGWAGTEEEAEAAVRAITTPFSAALRDLASYVGSGGYNAETVDPEIFEEKVRRGVDHLLNATIARCADVVEKLSKAPAGVTWGALRSAILDLTDPSAGPVAGPNDGYVHVFYEIADMLGVPARALSPSAVWVDEMRPKLKAALGAQKTDRLGAFLSEGISEDEKVAAIALSLIACGGTHRGKEAASVAKAALETMGYGVADARRIAEEWRKSQ